jgi:hypothetical protein
MPTLDVFKSDAFSLRSLIAAVNQAPYKPGRIGSLGLFRERGMPTVTAQVELVNGRLQLIPTSPRGAPATTFGQNKRTLVPMNAVHLATEEAIYADQVQGVRAFGSESEAQSVQPLVDQTLADQRASHEVTLERLRAKAIQGIITDSDGSTTLLDLFTAFGVSQQTAELTPNSSTDDGDALRGEVVAAQRLSEAELGAAPITGYRAFCGVSFFDTVRADLGVVQTLRYADPAALLQQEAGMRRFTFAGVAWEEYRGSTGGTAFFPTDEAYLVPESPGLFETYFAPADYIETVNTIGLPVYAKIGFDPEGLNRFVKVHVQSNPLVLCTRPRAVIKLTLPT